MTFRTDILDAVEGFRTLPGELDIRQQRVSVVVRAWTGSRVGDGTSTTTTTEILVSGYPPKVKELSSRDVVASGGRYTSGDVRVGPITPPHASGGVDPAVYNPATTASPAEVYFVLTGPGFPTGGARFERVSDDTLANFSHFLVLRPTGQVAT